MKRRRSTPSSFSDMFYNQRGRAAYKKPSETTEGKPPGHDQGPKTGYPSRPRPRLWAQSSRWWKLETTSQGSQDAKLAENRAAAAARKRGVHRRQSAKTFTSKSRPLFLKFFSRWLSSFSLSAMLAVVVAVNTVKLVNLAGELPPFF